MMDIKEHQHWFLSALKKNLFHHLMLRRNSQAQDHKGFLQHTKKDAPLFLSLFLFCKEICFYSYLFFLASCWKNTSTRVLSFTNSFQSSLLLLLQRFTALFPCISLTDYDLALNALHFGPLNPSTAQHHSPATQRLKEAVQDTDTIIARQVKAFAVTKQLNLRHDSPLTRVVSVNKSPTDLSQSLKTCTKRKQPIYSSTPVQKCQDKCFSMTLVETEHYRKLKRLQNVVRKLEKMLLGMNKFYHIDWFRTYII